MFLCFCVFVIPCLCFRLLWMKQKLLFSSCVNCLVKFWKSFAWLSGGRLMTLFRKKIRLERNFYRFHLVWSVKLNKRVVCGSSEFNKNWKIPKRRTFMTNFWMFSSRILTLAIVMKFRELNLVLICLTKCGTKWLTNVAQQFRIISGNSH